MTDVPMNHLKEPGKEDFNEDINAVLLANGFKFFDDWPHGPQAAWATHWELYGMQLMRHDFGYSIAIRAHASGENKIMPLGSSNKADDIIALKNALERLW